MRVWPGQWPARAHGAARRARTDSVTEAALQTAWRGERSDEASGRTHALRSASELGDELAPASSSDSRLGMRWRRRRTQPHIGSERTSAESGREPVAWPRPGRDPGLDGVRRGSIAEAAAVWDSSRASLEASARVERIGWEARQADGEAGGAAPARRAAATTPPPRL